MTNCHRLYSRRGEYLKLIDDDQARDLLSVGKITLKRNGRHTAQFQIADSGAPMRGFP
ncbi:hypothetical protein LCGC14_2660070, partial [marine sediment metagenome]